VAGVAPNLARRQPGVVAEPLELRPDVDGVFVVAAEHVEVATHFVGMSCPVAFLPHGINVPEDRRSASRLGVTKQRADSLSLQAQRESGRQHARGRSQARNERPTEADLLPVFYQSEDVPA